MEKTDDTKVKVYDFIKSNLLNGIVVITSIAYILYGMVTIEKTQLTIGEVLAQAGIGIIIAFIIKQALGESGFTKGYQSNIWQNNLEKYSHTCNLANPYIDRVDLFYDAEIVEKKKKYRQQNLNVARLKYSEFFDEEGNYIGTPIKLLKSPKKGQNNNVKILDKEQIKILAKCINVKIYNLNLFSEYGNEIENDTHREKIDKDQRTIMMSRNTLSAVLTAIVGAYFTTMWNNWNWGSFIMATIQVCIWVSVGIVQLYQNYNYVVIEKVNKLKRKMELIIKFVRGCEIGLYISKEQKEAREQNGQERVLDTICDIHSD